MAMDTLKTFTMRAAALGWSGKCNHFCFGSVSMQHYPDTLKERKDAISTMYVSAARQISSCFWHKLVELVSIKQNINKQCSNIWRHVQPGQIEILYLIK